MAEVEHALVSQKEEFQMRMVIFTLLAAVFKTVPGKPAAAD
jgi:hypothetical protein